MNHPGRIGIFFSHFRALFFSLYLSMNLHISKMLRAEEEEQSECEGRKKVVVVDLGDEGQVLYIPKFLSFQVSWNYFDFLNKQIPWTRPTIRVFGRSVLQVPPAPSHMRFCIFFSV